VFANHGVQMPVSLLALEGAPPAGKQIISPHVAEQLLAMLHTVTADEGTAKRARVPGFEVGGKTGTARIMGRNGYEENNYVALFTGIAPIDDPRIVTIVVINDPKGPNNHGGTAAAPVFSEMTRDTLRILNVPPSTVSTDGKAGKAKPGGAA
jgi:cell division protein FtsI (penicillin-binding protein 3)